MKDRVYALLGGFAAGVFAVYAAVCALLAGVLVPAALIKLLVWIVTG